MIRLDGAAGEGESMGYLQQAAMFVREGVASFHMPHLTDWIVTGTGGTTASVDVADAATLGATYLLPINVNVGGGTTEVSLRHRTANLSVTMEGAGGGVGAGVGWTMGTDGINLPSGGIGCMVAGPRADRVVISPADLEGFMTLRTLDVSFGPNGLSGGIVIFADRPVLSVIDLAFMKAFSMVWGIQFIGGSVAVGSTCMVFSSRVRGSSLPFPGARYGASVA
jgi:hypothetical protein